VSCRSHGYPELVILEAVTRSARDRLAAGVPVLIIARSIRNRLTALKRDRGEYIKPADVDKLYQAMLKQGARHAPLARVMSAHAGARSQ
jgi:ActR/RegA family two-component response regulator